MTKENITPVSQLEFSRHLTAVESALTDIKASLRRLDVKIDRINEEKIPSIREQVSGLSSRQKWLVGILGSAWGIVGGILIALGRALIGL